MDCSPVLLICLLQVFSMGRAAPLPDEVEQIKSEVATAANKLLERLNQIEDLKGLTLASVTDELQGSFCIVNFLIDYESWISTNFKGYVQIKSDTSDLIDSISKLPCNYEGPKFPTPELELFKIQIHDYEDTVSQKALLRIKEVVLLLLNEPERLDC